MFRFLLKKQIFLFLFVLSIGAFAQNRQLTVGETGKAQNQSSLVSQNGEEVTIRFNLNEIDLVEVTTDYGMALMANSHKAPWILEKGCPELFYLTSTLIIPNKGGFELDVTGGTFKDFENIEIAPSKGHLKRNIDPQTVPYVKGEAYSKNEFYPGKLASAREPFILRDVRGQSLDVFPVQYNPVTKVLRVYSEITVSMKKTQAKGVNEFKSKRRNQKPSREFNDVYQNQFINYAPSKVYPLGEEGDILVICYDDFMEAMQPYVDWKRTIGRNTTIVPKSEAGTTLEAIKSYITNFYNSEEHNLTYVLLVGDAAQIPVKNNGSSYYPSDTDNWYGYLEGNDSYNEIFIGRFSAETVAHVETQVQRTIHYERDLNTSDIWLNSGIGIAANEGQGNGHNGGEADYQHMNVIRNVLKDFTYTEVYQNYSGGCPGVPNTTVSQISQRFNEGVSIANYCNHGSQTGWSVAGYSSSHVNLLTNVGKLPFHFSTACLNGDFRNYTCFGETWLRASKNGEPTGAVAAIMASISQLWQPPMTGQDEMVMLLTENRDQKMRTFAGTAVNGSMKMISVHGNSGIETHDTWIVFGDPSLMLRTSAPQEMTVTHTPVLLLGMSSLSVECDTEGALAAVTAIDENNEVVILGTAVVENGTAEIVFNEPLTVPTNLNLAITGFNKVTYRSEISVIPADSPYIVMQSYNLMKNADFGKTIGINLELKNVSYEPYTASNVTINVVTENQYVILPETPVEIGDIEPGQVLFSEDGLLVTIAENVPDGEQIILHLTIACEYEGEEYTWEEDVKFTANAPTFEISEIFVEAENGARLEQINPKGENFLKVGFQNSGHADLSGINTAVSIQSEYISIDDNSMAIDTLKAGKTVYATFPLVVAANAPNTGIPVDMIVRASAGIFLNEAIETVTIGKPLNYFMSIGKIMLSYGNFYDSGGPNGAYQKNENNTIIFRPQTEDKKLVVNFSAIDLESGHDYLYIYNDTVANNDALLATLNNSETPPASYEATNEAGALTFVFTSDKSIQKSGWEAVIYEKQTFYNVSFVVTEEDETVTDAVIVFDGYTLGKNQLELSNVLPGKYAYSVTIEGYDVRNDTVDIAKDEVLTVNFTDVSIKENSMMLSIYAYPNPFTDVIYLGGKTSLVEKVYVTNMQGLRIKELHIKGTSLFATEDLPKGVYLITFEGYDKKVETVKMIKR
ncbi:MAG: C25 family cysteine peptidase [Cytophagaceae bacterium]|jgi:hypothetical protein|nr:C25 family cysteine peptidase [Cytophagaceae bacterium]